MFIVGGYLFMKKYGKLLFRVLAIGIILYAAYSFYNQQKPPQIGQQQPQTSSSDTGTKTSPKKQAAPELILKDLNGQTVTLSDYKGKVVILNFWASWCPPCKAEMPDLDATAKALASGQDTVLLAVNLTDGVRETVDKAKKYINDNNFSMTVLLDTEGRAANDYGITNIPTTFIIDKQGKIYDHIVGPTSKAVLLDYVSKLK
jgi:cytochrome c biogenesis protein CcmG, thiol:disulfide interchange protein DsbE